MKYTNEHEETSIWIGLSVAWMLGGLLAWALAVFSSEQPLADGGLLTLIAGVLSLISCILRLPILTAAPEQSLLPKHIVWLLGVVANMNWFGFLCLRTESISEVVPAGIIFFVGEMWLLPKALRGDCLPWANAWFLRATREMRARLKTASGEHQPASRHVPATAPDPFEALGKSMSSEDPLLQTNVYRRSTDGLDEQGRRYMSGEILLELETDQTTETVVIGFCPPFGGTPTVELEVASLDNAKELGEDDLDEVEARVLTCSPMGVRILIKRVPAHSSRKLTLGWYALVDSPVEDLDAGAAIPHRTPQTLP